MASKSVRVPKRFRHLGMEKYMNLRNAAYHEAGHAALQLEFGWTVRKVYVDFLESNDDIMDYSGHAKTDYNGIFDFNDKEVTKEFSSKKAMASMAGLAAEIFLESQDDGEEDCSLEEFVLQCNQPGDYNDALEACKLGAATEREAYRLLEKCLDKTMELVTTPRIWEKIEIIAKALLKSPNLTLGEEDIQRLFPEKCHSNRADMWASYNAFSHMSTSQSEHLTDLVTRFAELYPKQEMTMANIISRFNELHPSEKLKVNPAMKNLFPGLTE